MARKDSAGGGEKENAPKGTAKVEDIVTGSKSLAEGTSYEDGYPDTMQHHINRGASKSSRRGGAD